MLSFFREIREKDEKYRRRFVVFATAFSFLLIFSVWVPVRLAQLRTDNAPKPSPAVAGEQTQKLPFLNDAGATPPVFESVAATPSIVVSQEPAPSASPESPEELPAASSEEYPTL